MILRHLSPTCQRDAAVSRAGASGSESQNCTHAYRSHEATGASGTEPWTATERESTVSRVSCLAPGDHSVVRRVRTSTSRARSEKLGSKEKRCGKDLVADENACATDYRLPFRSSLGRTHRTWFIGSASNLQYSRLKRSAVIITGRDFQGHEQCVTRLLGREDLIDP